MKFPQQMARLRQQRDAGGLFGANGKGGDGPNAEKTKDESPSTARRDGEEEEEEDDMYGENQVHFTWVYSKHVEREKEKEEKDRLKTMPCASAAAAAAIIASATADAAKSPCQQQGLKSEEPTSSRPTQADGNVLNSNNTNNDDVDSVTFDGEMGRRRSSASCHSSSPGVGVVGKARKNSSSAAAMTTISESDKENDGARRKRGR